MISTEYDDATWLSLSGCTWPRSAGDRENTMLQIWKMRGISLDGSKEGSDGDKGIYVFESSSFG